MFYLYQFGFLQPHYVVARNYGHAEQLITDGGYSAPDEIKCLGNYVILPSIEDQQ